MTNSLVTVTKLLINIFIVTQLSCYCLESSWFGLNAEVGLISFKSMNACIEQVLLGVDFPDVCGASSCFWAACRVRAGCSATNLRSADTTNKARPAELYYDPSVKLYNHGEAWLKAPTSAFTFKTLLRHYTKQVLVSQTKRSY